MGVSMKTGLMRLLQDVSVLSGKSVGVCCNHTAIDHRGDHIISLLLEQGIPLTRIFGPEHGVDSTAQDMIAVEDSFDPTQIPTVSLYEDTEESLHPKPETLQDIDILLFDIQDIGARYYTYQATLGYMMEVAKDTDTEIWVLDRPNPINGFEVSGNVVQPGFESFVSAYPLATRHGMTMGEMGNFFQKHVKIDCPIRVIEMEGWNRMGWFEETGLPFVYPSPNMPTVDTTIIYVGMCLIEGTNISEGRGTTKPFHLFGAPWIDKRNLLRLLRTGAADANLEGVLFRESTFEPRFQKHSGEICHGAEIIITDRTKVEPLLLGLVVLEALIRENPSRFAWRTETYEFVDNPIAIDLLFGNHEGRGGLETKVPPRDILAGWKSEIDGFLDKRDQCLIYSNR
jgi:uncharacterized protein YbbC (DUF1343 family)